MTAALAETAYRRSDTGAREPVPGALPCGCEYASRSVHTLTRHAPIVTSVSADGKINKLLERWSTLRIVVRGCENVDGRWRSFLFPLVCNGPPMETSVGPSHPSWQPQRIVHIPQVHSLQ